MNKVVNFFDYYWENNRLAAMSSQSDKRMMDELPESVESQIYIDYLFADFLKSYKKYFNSMQEKFNHSIFKNQSKKHFSAQN